MQHAISLLAVVPMRKEPSHRSEMVSQLLFGEFVKMGERKDDFVPVISLFDNYEGWVQINQLTPIDAGEERQPAGYLTQFCGQVIVDGKSITIPFGAPLYSLGATPVHFGNRRLHGTLSPDVVWPVEGKAFSPVNLQPVIDLFLNSPYLWGGKSVFGTDCSGFVQQVFKLFGVKLLRDAYLQAEQGLLVEDFDKTVFGDLLFFQNEKGRVMHVGILLFNNQIVHASGRVRIDNLDKEGIINHETGERTHRFHSIRRFF
jgi:hypothetical protein